MIKHVLVSMLLVVALSSCSDGPGGNTDAATDAPDADDGVEMEAPTPPEPPAPPVFTPCPDGWREVEDVDTGIVTCDPWPEGGPEECGADEAHFPGEPGCTRIGTACPTGDWAEDLPTDREILYVRAGEPSGGDGTIGSPFGTIADAMAVADPLTVVALSKGTFDEAVILRGAITLWGACVAETILTCSVPSETGGTITVAGSDTEVRNLTVGGQRSGVWVGGTGRVAVIEDVVISEATSFGVMVDMGGQATGRSIVVRDTAARAGGVFGRGLNAVGGARVEVTRGMFERNREAGISVSGVDTTVVLHDVGVRHTRSDALGRERGVGLLVQGGASVEVARGVFENNRLAGVFATESGTSIAMVDIVVRDTLSQEADGMAGYGVASRGAHVSVTRGAMTGNREVGVIADLPGTLLEMVDVVVGETMGRDADGANGRGLGVQAGAQARVTRSMFVSNRYVGASVAGAGSSLELTDVTVLDTQGATSDASAGVGLSSHGGASCTATRVLLQDNRLCGVLSEGAGTVLVISDVAVLDTLSEEVSGLRGIGLAATEGARVEMTRASLERNRSYGIMASMEGTHVILSEVTISSTLERACVVDTCAGYGAGTGLGVFAGAHVDVSNFVITGNVLCGVQIARGVDDFGVYYARGGTIDLHDGEISYNPVGVNVQTEGFDVERLMDGVEYIENDINLDMSELPVPDVGLWP
ncbi:MAG: right-handed parallel beta-helix repeat-containing protein [Deltaproteobacteria bacterium]|nr:right-handed parallel beta-helix repeat-containing protein [Deltaproteobacteria bacterium]